MATILMGKCLLEVVPMMNIMSGSVRSIFDFTDTLVRKSTKKEKITENDVMDYIDTQDIKNKLMTYKLLLKEFPCTISKSINATMESVRDIVTEIERKINMIENKINYNKKLWTRTYAYPIADDYKKLQILIKKLDERIAALKTVTELAKMINADVFNGSYIANIKDLDDEENYEGLQSAEYIKCITDITHEIKK
mgnify:CR=1 FL=1